MILACDGIWNSMTSQEVVEFCCERMEAYPEEKLSELANELFESCLAPNTLGDGTGCDNMTAVIVRFKKGSGSGGRVELEAAPIVKKRSNESGGDQEENPSKKKKTCEEAETGSSASKEEFKAPVAMQAVEEKETVSSEVEKEASTADTSSTAS